MFVVLTTQPLIAQTWDSSTVATTTSDYNTSIQLTTTNWGAQHGILFNSYRSGTLVNGSLSIFGNTKHGFDVGSYSSGAGAIMFLGNGGSLDFFISNISTGANTNVDWGTPKMTITRSGSVGIGTWTPAFSLDVSGTMRGYGNLMTSGVATGNGYYADDGAGSTIFSITRQSNNETRFQSYGYHTFYSGNSTGSEKMRITGSGNIGIGTANPDERLTVNGKIKAEEVQVVVDVPADYVFDSAYKLKPLHEVEMFIKSNGHLPGVPNAVALKETGWVVGEMSNKLLEKIEELTLYMIELQKENALLKSRLEKLEKR